MTETETSRRSTAAGRGRRADEARTTDHEDTRVTLGVDPSVTPDESPALALSLTQDHALEVLLEEARQQITEEPKETQVRANRFSLLPLVLTTLE